MKFCKNLSSLIEQTLPEWRDKFLSYKDLKKQLKRICPKEGGEGGDNGSGPAKRPRLAEALDGTAASESCAVKIHGSDEEGGEIEAAPTTTREEEVSDFEKLLEDEIEKFNSFFVEKEEEYVIKWKELQDRVSEANNSNEELMRIGREVVDFHGEMVLLENYSALNYTGLVKILKKYDKRIGTLIRLPFIQNVLQQPFYSNDTLCKLVKECESMLNRLFSEKVEPSALPKTISNSHDNISTTNGGTTTASEPKEGRLVSAPEEELEEIKHMENMYMKLTLSALRVLKEIRSGSSTVSAFSLPPLQISGSTSSSLEEVVTPVVEQTAK